MNNHGQHTNENHIFFFVFSCMLLRFSSLSLSACFSLVLFVSWALLLPRARRRRRGRHSTHEGGGGSGPHSQTPQAGVACTLSFKRLLAIAITAYRQNSCDIFITTALQTLEVQAARTRPDVKKLCETLETEPHILRPCPILNAHSEPLLLLTSIQSAQTAATVWTCPHGTTLIPNDRGRGWPTALQLQVCKWLDSNPREGMALARQLPAAAEKRLAMGHKTDTVEPLRAEASRSSLYEDAGANRQSECCDL